MQLALEIRNQFEGKNIEVLLEPSKTIGSFEVFFGADLVYSKGASRRMPYPGEIVQILMMRIFKNNG